MGKLTLIPYPNPTKNTLYFKDFIQGEVSITSAREEVILAREVVKGFIDIHSLSAGVYFISLQKDDQLYRARFVKE